MDKPNIAIITIDSLRWDVAVNTDTPYLNRLFKLHKTKWYKLFSHGTYTLPTHISLFQGAMLPFAEIGNKGVPAIFQKKAKKPFISMDAPWKQTVNPTFKLGKVVNMVKGFEEKGYRTVGIGGVNWFNTNFPSSDIWGQYFSEFYWQEKFQQLNKNCFLNQIKFMESLNLKETTPLFFFLNIASTHPPCRGKNSLQGQREALMYIDQHIGKVFNLLPRPCHTIIFSDHGTLFGENGVRGHAVHHPKVFTVPGTYIKFKEKDDD